ncbi:hypothetical protein IAU59_002729 [Kwoniella sp. CBS 9459]
MSGGSSASLTMIKTADEDFASLISARDSSSSSSTSSVAKSRTKSQAHRPPLSLTQTSSSKDTKPRPSLTSTQRPSSSSYSNVAGPSSTPRPGPQHPSNYRADRIISASQKPHNHNTHIIRRANNFSSTQVTVRDKGKGKQTEPIDLTLSDTDDELAPTPSTIPLPENMSSSRLSDSSSSGSIVALPSKPIDFDMRSKLKSTSKIKDRDKLRNRLGRTSSGGKRKDGTGGVGGGINSKADWQKHRQPHLNSTQSNSIVVVASENDSGHRHRTEAPPTSASSSASRPTSPIRPLPAFLKKPRHPSQNSKPRSVSPQKNAPIIKISESQQSPPSHPSRLSRDLDLDCPSDAIEDLDDHLIPQGVASASTSNEPPPSRSSVGNGLREQTLTVIKAEKIQASPARSPLIRLGSQITRRMNSREWEEALKRRHSQTPDPSTSQTPSPAPPSTQKTKPDHTNGEPMQRVRSGSNSIAEPGMRTATNFGLAPVGFGGPRDSKVKQESPLKKFVQLPDVAESEEESDKESEEEDLPEYDEASDPLPPLVKASPSPAKKRSSSTKKSKVPSKSPSTSTTTTTTTTSTPLHRLTGTQAHGGGIVNKRVSRVAREDAKSDRPRSSQSNKRHSLTVDEDEESYRPKPSASHNRTASKPSTRLPVEGSSSRDRPIRHRLKDGAYTIPSIDTPMEDWPRGVSTHAAGGSMKRSSLTGQDAGKVKSTYRADKSGSSNITGPIDKRRSPVKKPTQSSISLQRTLSGSTNSTLTPPPSPTPSQSQTLAAFHATNAQREAPGQEQNANVKSHNVSPTRSLSATPAKALFPQLLPDVELPSPSRQDVFTVINDEEKEEIEEEARAPEPDADDIFAEFEDYEWAASDGEDDAAQENIDQHDNGLPQPSMLTEDNDQASAPPMLGESGPMASTQTPTRSYLALSSEGPPHEINTSTKQSESQDQSNPKTPRSSQKRTRPSSTSMSPEHSKRHLSSDHWDKLLKEEAAIREQEREESRKKAEAMQSDLDRIADAEDREKAENEGPSDLSSFLNDIANASPEKPVSSPKKPSMISAVASRANGRLSRAEAAALAKKQNKVDALRAAKQAEHLRQLRKEERTFGALLNSIKKSEDFHEAMMGTSYGDNLSYEFMDLEAEEAYPTPRSETGSGHDTDETMNLSRVTGGDDNTAEQEMDLEKMVERARGEGMVIDAELVRDAKAAKVGRDGGLQWAGFWRADPQPSKFGDSIIRPDFTMEGNSIWDLATQAIDRNDAHMLSMIVGSPAFESVSSNDVARWLFINALQSGDPDWARTAQEAFVDLTYALSKALDLPWLDLESDLVQAMYSMGAEPSVVSSHPVWREERKDSPCASTNKEETCAFICRVISSNTRLAVSVKQFSAAGWIPILLLLSVDARTSYALRRRIAGTIGDVLALALRQDSRAQAKVLAQAICKSTENYSDAVRAAVLDSLGQRTSEAREVHRWLGMEYLTRGTLDAIMSMETPPKVPTIAHIIEALKTFHIALRPETGDPDYTDLNHRVTFLYAALSDFGALLDQHPVNMVNGGAGDKGSKDLLADSELEGIRTWIRLCRDRISDQSNGTEKSTVKARLHQLYEFSRLLLLVEIKKKIRTKRAGKGYKFASESGRGKGGQTMLDFGPAKVMA